jgi:nucleoside-diphosphate-sugar epimerase
MKILFVGGTGVISSACSKICAEAGHELYHLNRGKSTASNLTEVETLKADINDAAAVQSILRIHRFDVIVDRIAFEPAHVERDFEYFKDKTSQYIFISSASAYAKPPAVPLTENHPLDNPYWEYSANKIRCEKYLMEAHRKKGFPVTIVRPSHTYDKTKIPLSGGFTALNRLLNKQKVIIHGDGTTLWTLTHHMDFARGFAGILGKQQAIGEAYHITGDEVLTWNQICYTFADVLGVSPNIIHIPSDFIAHFDKDWGDGLLGDKAYNMVLDNSKIKAIHPGFKAEIPFSKGAQEIVDWHMADKSRQVSDPALNATMEKIIARHESALRA